MSNCGQGKTDRGRSGGAREKSEIGKDAKVIVEIDRDTKVIVEHTMSFNIS